MFQKGNQAGRVKKLGAFERHREVKDICAERGVDPALILAEFASGFIKKKSGKIEKIGRGLQLVAAKELMKYIYPTKKAVEVTIPKGEEAAKLIVELVEATASESK